MEAIPEDESRLVKVFGTFGDIFALNVLWVICSLPIVTVGASTTALYSVMLKLIKKEEGPIVKSFFTAFRDNFKQATIAWLVVLLVLVGIGGELTYAYVCDFQGALAFFYLLLGFFEFLVVALVLPFLFPLIARYENTLWNTFKNAALLSVGNLGSWIKIVLAWCVPVFVTIAYPIVFFYTWYLWLLVIVGIIAYGTSFTINKVFKRIAGAQEAKQEPTQPPKQKKEVRTNTLKMRGLVRQGAKGNIREHANIKTK
jgi:uncharacterized membrane protein YesL